jgi:hypothetical protein
MAAPPLPPSGDFELRERLARVEANVENLYEEVRGLKRACWGGVAAVVGATIVYLMKQSDSATAEAVFNALPF